MTANQQHVDFALIGGGVVGHLLAHGLAERGYQTLLLDAAPHQEQSDEADLDGRNIALTYGSVNILQKMGVWPAIEAHAYPVEHIHVSFRGYRGITRLHAKEEGYTHFGAMVRLSPLLAAVKQRVEQQPLINAQYGVRCESMTQDDEGVKITAAGQTYTADYTIGADGARSFVREALAITHTHTNYGQTAIVGQLKVNKSHQNWAYERFTQNGPIAILPLQDQHVGFVWTVQTDAVDEMMALDERAFLEAFQAAFGYRAGRFLSVGKRFTYPLHAVMSDTLHQGRVVLCGNAAQSVHPVAGQGLNMGIRDVVTALNHVDQSLFHAPDPWQAYARLRMQDRQAVFKLTDGLNWTFTHPFVPVQWAASQALRRVERSTWLKTWVNQRFMGYQAEGLIS